MQMQAYDAAVAMLARRDHSRRELQQKLTAKFPAEATEIRSILERIVSQGLQCDKRYAENYTCARMRKGFGPERIRLELKGKGVDVQWIVEVLDAYETEWCERARLEWRKKYKCLPVDFKERAKQSNFLRYRGFRAEDIKAVFDE